MTGFILFFPESDDWTAGRESIPVVKIAPLTREDFEEILLADTEDILEKVEPMAIDLSALLPKLASLAMYGLTRDRHHDIPVSGQEIEEIVKLHRMLNKDGVQ